MTSPPSDDVARASRPHPRAAPGRLGRSHPALVCTGTSTLGVSPLEHTSHATTTHYLVLTARTSAIPEAASWMPCRAQVDCGSISLLQAARPMDDRITRPAASKPIYTQPVLAKCPLAPRLPRWACVAVSPYHVLLPSRSCSFSPPLLGSSASLVFRVTALPHTHQNTQPT